MSPETERATSDQGGLAPDEGVVGPGDQTIRGKQTGAAGTPRTGGPDIGPATRAKGSLQDAIPPPEPGRTPASQDDGSGSDWRRGPTPADEDDGSGSNWREDAGSVG